MGIVAKLAGQPLWLAGFRPFFALAMLSGLSLPVLWVLLYSGRVAAPHTTFTVVQWHAHEMFFGFGWAVLGGFLLTSTKNWVKVRGYHGPALMFLAAAWLFERSGMWCESAWPKALFLLSNNLFIASIVAMLVWTLVKNRATDSYRNNYLFLLILPSFLIGKYLMLSPEHFLLGSGMVLALFRMAFLVMLERTLTQFMKGAFQVSILQHPQLDGAIKLLGLLLVVGGLLPPAITAWAGLLLALLLAARLAFWKPQLAFRRIDIGIMYLGYLAIVAQLLVEFFRLTLTAEGLMSLSIHVFTFGAMGLIIPAMLIRISQGHTGRKVVFDSLDKLVLYVMLAAFVLRILAPQIHPQGYTLWLALAAGCWFTGFVLLAWRYIPVLMRPRLDGKEH
ncbi:MAG TPA: NnrS family protein [Gallionella sp.]